jgi:hypothetical protein
MIACVGWPADPVCPFYGDMHGCRHPDGHNGKRHECACGSTIRSPDLPIERAYRQPSGTRVFRWGNAA